jgi:hypothetical protein
MLFIYKKRGAVWQNRERDIGIATQPFNNLLEKGWAKTHLLGKGVAKTRH